jgi:hypothetical protein
MGNQDTEDSMPPQTQTLELRRFPVRRLFKNHSHVSMRNLARVALLLFGSMAVASADVLTYNAVLVTGVNQRAYSFTVDLTEHVLDIHRHVFGMEHAGMSRAITFKTNDKTTYWMGSTKGSWTDVKKGARVNVMSHSEGSNKVVDKVQIVSGS